MKRVKERIAFLEKRAVAAPVETIETEGVALRHNTERDSLELSFPGKPEASVIAKLKLHGWKWARTSGCWYRKWSQFAEQTARELIAQINAD